MSTRLAPPPTVPATVTAASTLWFTAVGAGAFEAALHLMTTDVPLGQAAFRAAVFAAAIFLAVRLRQGRNWARIALALTLGVFGTLSLVMEPVQWMLAGHSVTQFLADADAATLAVTAARIVHINAVLGAMVLMFSKPSSAYFRSSE